VTPEVTPEVTASTSETPKPKRPSRWGLFAPFIIFLVILAGWSGYWFYTAHQLETRIEAQKQALIKQGYHVGHEPLKVRGYPFRMYLKIEKFQLIAPTGKGFGAERIEAEANAYALDKWIMVAPKGITLYRGRVAGGDIGTVKITGDGLRASISGFLKPVQNIAIEGLNPVFVPSDPAFPFALNSAQRFEAYLRPTKDVSDSADVLLRITGAKGPPQTIIGRLGQDKAFDLHIEGEITPLSKFKGADFDQALAAWRLGGGVMKKVKTSLTIDELQLFAQSEALKVDDRLALIGHVDLEIKGNGDPVGFLLNAGLIEPKYRLLATPFVGTKMSADKPIKLGLDFRDGGTYMGALKLSDAPALQ
jgi:hypothetical protein